MQNRVPLSFEHWADLGGGEEEEGEEEE